ncbi:MAG: hypothetical protein RL410_968 [Actinomycetota bacterium]|jgi:hypothetical protein
MNIARTLLQFLVYYRRWVSVALVLVIVYALVDGQRPGQSVLVVTQSIAEGQPLHDVDVIRAADFPDDITPLDVQDLSGLVAKFPLTPGTIITHDNIARHHQTDTVIVSLPIESIAPHAIINGSHIHVWALFEDHSSLVSTESRLISVLHSSMTTIATIEIPAADEYEVMQANGLRIAGAGSVT